MSEEKKGFTVADRRRFTTDGALREEESHGASDAAQVRVPDAAPRPAEAPTGGSAGGTGDAATDFGGFLMSLAAQASLLLGLAPGAQEPPDLPGARSIISILEMLKDKTEGRRTREEEQILDGILYELRMAYLSQSRGGA
jgi:hypothetical protein